MTRGNRPLSPHLQIYRPQLTWVLSILHRFTGVVLSVGALLLVGWLMAAASGPSVYSKVAPYLVSTSGLIIIAAFSFALIYHLLNGIRHLIWDTGHWLRLREVYASGWAVVILAMVLTTTLWIIVLLTWSDTA